MISTWYPRSAAYSLNPFHLFNSRNKKEKTLLWIIYLKNVILLSNFVLNWLINSNKTQQESIPEDAYRPRRKVEQWTSSHEANCGQTETRENITFPLRSLIITNGTMQKDVFR